MKFSVGNEGVTYDEPVVERVSARIHESGYEPYPVRYIRQQKRNRSIVLVVSAAPGEDLPTVVFKYSKTKKVKETCCKHLIMFCCMRASRKFSIFLEQVVFDNWSGDGSE